MKTRKIGIFLVAVLLILTLASCDMINNFIKGRMRDIPVINIYNSNLEKTTKLLPNDTLFVEVGGLKPLDVYDVKCQDAEGNTIAQLTTQADENGMIAPSPLWYDIGFKRDTETGLPVLASNADLTVAAFNINVRNADTSVTSTNLTLPFSIFYNKNVARPQPIVMAVDLAGELENSFEAGEQLWVKVLNFKDTDPLPPSQDHATVHLVPFKGTAYLDGDAIFPSYLSQEFTAQELKDGVQITGTDEQSGVWATGIPSTAQGKAFSIILDCDNNGRYDVRKDGMSDYYLDAIDGNMAPGFVVMNPPVSVDFIPANIASGGIYTWDYSTWAYDYDYRDQFKIEGLDTRYAWDWQFGGYGVKATWNPYISWSGTAASVDGTPSIYYGTYVDVYIVNHTDSYTGEIIPAPDWGLDHLTMPVQYSCYNGCGQQTIWRADGDDNEENGGLVVGKYDVVVDVNRDGEYSDGDIIDNQPRNQTDLTGYTARSDGGFEVVLNY
ncbi:MAG: hypothetical protein WAZ99_08125 [Rectinemataceae bacterium]